MGRGGGWVSWMVLYYSVNGLWSRGLAGLKDRCKVPFDHAKGLTLGLDVSITVHKILKQDWLVWNQECHSIWKNTTLTIAISTTNTTTTRHLTVSSWTSGLVIGQLQWELEQLERHGIQPFLVLDGITHHPMKQTVAHVQRRQARDKARLELQQLLYGTDPPRIEEDMVDDDDDKDERDHLQRIRRTTLWRHCKTLSVPTADLWNDLVRWLQHTRPQSYMVAPFEAEWQLVYLEQQGLIHGIVSRDGDCVILGANRVYTEVDYTNQRFTIYQRNHVLVGHDPVSSRHAQSSSSSPPLEGEQQLQSKPQDGVNHGNNRRTATKTTSSSSSSLYLLNADNVDYWPELAALAGCDYIVSPKGIAMGRAIQHVFDRAWAHHQQQGQRQTSKVPPAVLVQHLQDYCETIQRSSNSKKPTESPSELIVPTDNRSYQTKNDRNMTIQPPPPPPPPKKNNDSTCNTENDDEEEEEYWDHHLDRFLHTIHLLRHCPVGNVTNLTNPRPPLWNPHSHHHNNNSQESESTLPNNNNKDNPQSHHWDEWIVPLNPLPQQWNAQYWGLYIGFQVLHPASLLQERKEGGEEEGLPMAVTHQCPWFLSSSSSSFLSSGSEDVDAQPRSLVQQQQRQEGQFNQLHHHENSYREDSLKTAPNEDEAPSLFANLDWNHIPSVTWFPTLVLEAFVTARLGVQAAPWLGPTTTRDQLETLVHKVQPRPVWTRWQLYHTMEWIQEWLAMLPTRSTNVTHSNDNLWNSWLEHRTKYCDTILQQTSYTPDDWTRLVEQHPNHDWWQWWWTVSTPEKQVDSAVDTPTLLQDLYQDDNDAPSLNGNSSLLMDPHRTLWLQSLEPSNHLDRNNPYPSSHGWMPRRIPVFGLPPIDVSNTSTTNTWWHMGDKNAPYEDCSTLVFHLQLLQKLLRVIVR